MNLTSWILAAVFAGTLQALAEPSTPIGPAEEQLVGHWVLQGVLGGKETVHDVAARVRDGVCMLLMLGIMDGPRFAASFG